MWRLEAENIIQDLGTKPKQRAVVDFLVPMEDDTKSPGNAKTRLTGALQEPQVSF